MSLYFDPGTEKWVAWARGKLAALSLLRKKIGVPALARAYEPEQGTLVRISSTPYAESIRITGGTALVEYDPFHDLWSIHSAIMPWTRPGVDPALPYGPVIQHISSYYPNGDRSYTRRHWLVICRYCERVAQYTWDETGVLVDNPAYDPALAESDSNRRQVLQVTGAYVSHTSDGSAVTLADSLEPSAPVNRTVEISPALVEQSAANDYGWISHDDSLHPGSMPAAVGISGTQVFSSSTTIGYTPGSPSHLPVESGSRTIVYTFSDGHTIENTSGSFTTHISGVSAGPGVIAFINLVYGEPISTYNGLPLWNDWTDGGTVYWYVDAGVDAYLASANAGYPAALEAWCMSKAQKAVEIYDAVLRKMDAKKFTAPDLNELRPYPEATDHRKTTQALVIPAYAAASLNCESCQSQSVSYDFRSAAMRPDQMPTSIYGVQIRVPTAEPPTGPWTVTISAPLAFPYTHESKSFGAAVAGPQLRHAAFSRGTSAPLVWGGVEAVRYNGYYRVRGLRPGFAEISAADLNTLMGNLCIGRASRSNLAFAVYHSVTPGAQASSAITYRATPHVHTQGDYSFTQPVL